MNLYNDSQDRAGFYSKLRVGVFILAALTLHHAEANVGSTYGLDSAIRALGSANAATDHGPGSAYHNPAALVLADSPLQFSLGLVYVQPSFKPISNIVTENTYVNHSLQTGNVEMDYQATLGQEFLFSYRFMDVFPRLTLGTAAYLPLSHFATMDSGPTYIPEYFMERARTQRPQVGVAVASQLGKGFSFGVGAHAAFSLTSNARIYLNTQTASTSSTMRFASSMKPKMVPYFGVLYATESERFSVGLVARLAAVSENNMVLHSAARAFGTLGPIDFSFLANSALYYDPGTLELGTRFEIFEDWKIFVQEEFQNWNQFQPPSLTLSQPSGSPFVGTSTIAIAPGVLPNLTYRNIFVTRIGVEWGHRDSLMVYRAGYSYRPSIVESSLNEAGNFLDPNRHTASLGVGIQSKSLLGVSLRNDLNINVAFQFLESFRVSKSAGNEVGNASDQKIGAPGYEVGGILYGGGVSLRVYL